MWRISYYHIGDVFFDEKIVAETYEEAFKICKQRAGGYEDPPSWRYKDKRCSVVPYTIGDYEIFAKGPKDD